MTDRPVPGGASSRVVLEGVPRVSFFEGGERCPEDVPFPSCLRAWMEFMGDGLGCQHVTTPKTAGQVDCGYAYIMGVSGMAFRLLWKPGWYGDNVDVLVMAEDAHEPLRRAFEAVGYEHEFIGKAGGRDDEAHFRRCIIESIRDKGRPVIGFGVVGPPECCLITGYDDGGDALVGWNFFQNMADFNAGVEFEPLGYFRKRNWYPDTPAIIVVGDRRARPLMSAIGREALEWALHVMRTPEVRGRRNGFAAFSAWAEALSHDDEFPMGDIAALRERYMAHNDAVSTVAEGRWYGGQFLKEMARRESGMAGPLLDAAACFEREHDLMWDVWNLAGGNAWTDVQVRKLAEPAVRQQIIPVILQARDMDIEGSKHIERALAG